MFCSNCGKQVADGSKFCPSCGFGLVEVSSPNTNTRMNMNTNMTIPLKWSQDDIQKLNRDIPALLDALTQMQEFAHYIMDCFLTPIGNLEAKCKKLDDDYGSFRGGWFACIGMVAVNVGVFLYQLAKKDDYMSSGGGLFGEMTRSIWEWQEHVFYCMLIPMTILVILVLGNLIYSLSIGDAAWKYKKTRSETVCQIDALKKQFQEVQLSESYVSRMAMGESILPDYYLFPDALDYMIKAIRNHQAATLGQAVTLYEQHADRVKAMQKMEQIRKQLANLKVTTYNYYTVVHRQY